MKTKAFNNDKYIKLQSEHILERINKFDNKLYLELGGKLFDDGHAARVLPGFEEDAKLKMLLELKDKAEVIIVVNAHDIENNQIRGDLGIGYDGETLRLIDSFMNVGFDIAGVMINQFENQPDAIKFKEYLNSMGIKTYLSYTIFGYPHNVDKIVSDEGFGKNEYVKTKKPLVVVTGPGPGSGKLLVCLSQMYHENKRGIKAGYAKFETFPVWNLNLRHPVNLAYEAATANLNDVNMIDPYHLEAYGQMATNYNRDVEAYPILETILTEIMGYSPYKSPTDMGVNMVGFCIEDNKAVEEASKQEIIRRYFDSLCDIKTGKASRSELDKIELLMKQLKISSAIRKVVSGSRKKAKESQSPAFALQLEDGKIVTGRQTKLLNAPSACILNALKIYANINDDIPLISPNILEPILELKDGLQSEDKSILHLDEVMIALAMSATTNPLSHQALTQLDKLKGLEGHSTVMLEANDKELLRNLGISFTQSPKFRTKGLFKNY